MVARVFTGIDHFKVYNDAILQGLQGVQNYWGERKIYSKCMKQSRVLMLDNLSSIAIYPFYELGSKDT